MEGLYGGVMHGRMNVSIHTVGRVSLPLPITPDDCPVQTEGPAPNHHVIARPQAVAISRGTV